VATVGTALPPPALRFALYTNPEFWSKGLNVPVGSSAPLMEMICAIAHVGVAERFTVTVSEEIAAEV
jgi:hypothetical protein